MPESLKHFLHEEHLYIFIAVYGKVLTIHDTGLVGLEGVVLRRENS